MSQETLEMSDKERKRLIVMNHYERGKMLLKEAAWKMKVSVRQAIRIKKRFQADGAQGLVHGSRGIVSRRGFGPQVRRQTLEIYQ